MKHDFLRPPGWNVKLGKKPKAVHVPVFNDAVADIEPGSIVILDYSNVPASGEIFVATTTTVNHPLTYGVAVTKILANSAAPGYVCRYGPAELAVKGAGVNITAGNYICTGGVAGYGYKSVGTFVAGVCVGTALDAKAADSVLGTASGYITVFVDPGILDVTGTATATELNLLDLSAKTVTVAEAAKATGITAAARVVKITGGTGFTGLVLPVPTAAEVGMIKQIILDTISSSTVAMTITNIAVGGTAATTATFTNAGEVLTLIGAVYGTTYRWIVLDEHGVVLS